MAEPPRRRSLPMAGGSPMREAHDGELVDPICGMKTRPDGPHTLTHDGTLYSFCSAGCKARFLAAKGAPTPPPGVARHDGSKAKATPTPPQGAGTYTCPMHPEIVQVGPGTCPLCGMALEPRAVTTDDGEHPELTDFRRRLVVAAPLTLALVALAMGGMLGLPVARLGPARRFVELALATPVVLWCGWPFLVRAAESVRRWQLNMFTLIGLGVIVAYGESVVAAVAPGVFPASFGHTAPLYFEAAATIITLVLVGQVLELRARAATGEALRALLRLAPPVAHRLEAAGERDVPLAEVAVGDRLRVRPGEHVPVDGVVIDGQSAVDEAMVTGEAVPVDKAVGAKLLAGTLNTSGSLVLRAVEVGQGTVLARIVALVAEAQRTRAPIQRLADRAAGLFVPAVVAVAALAFALWATLGPEPRLAGALLNAVAVLIIACPCALGLATPMSIMVASGRGAQAGLLFRNAEAIETLGRVDVVVLDKTGTLTEGKPAVARVVAAAGASDVELIRIAATLEQGSEHPLARAIVAAAAARELSLGALAGFAAAAGGGVRGTVDGVAARLGTADFLAAAGLDLGAMAAPAAAAAAAGESIVFVALAERVLGFVGLRDPIKPSAAATIRALSAAGVEVVMLSGDRREVAERVGRELGIARVVAGALPAAKAAEIDRLRAAGHRVAMVGDGVNDAPALARADVGVALATGTDVAIATAGLTLVGGDLAGLVRARRLSRATLRNIRQNLGWAFGYNLLGVPVAAGALYPVFGVLLSPMLAAAAMSLSSVSVIGNALRLRRVDLG